MGKSNIRACILLLAIALAGAIFAAPAQAQKDAKVRRVLIVYENESTQFAAVEIARGLRRGLDETFPTQFEIYTEYLDNQRFPDPENLSLAASHLVAKYRKMQLDVVITAGTAALKFMLLHRDEIAPGTPMLFGAVSEAVAASVDLPPDVRGVVSSYDVKQTLTLARDLFPRISKVVVITGEAEYDRAWRKMIAEQLGASFEGFEIGYMDGLSLDGFMRATAALDPQTVILMMTIYRDADGRNYVPREAAAQIEKVAAAPVFVVYDAFLGAGAVGGYMDTFEGIGTTLAGLASEAFAGKAGGPQIVQAPAHAMLDWREVIRWGISPENVPDGAEIRFRTPSAWEQYRTEILAIVALILFQSLLITALIIQAQRASRAQRELDIGRRELAHLSRASLLGELSGAFAHELNQPLTAILANAEVGKRLLERKEPDLVELKEILGEIVDDDKRAAGIIAQLRGLLVKGETVLEPVDLNQVVTATLTLSRGELLSRQTKVEFRREVPEAMVLGNFAQLQQIVLNLLVNAAEAMSRASSEQRVIETTVRASGDARFEIAVSDNGPGLAAEEAKSVFKPFVSTKANGLGLGLAICRTIASVHKGTLDFDTTQSRGARVVLSLPRYRGGPKPASGSISAQG